jgi:hypothetical protein
MGVGRRAEDLGYVKIIVAKSSEVKTGSNVAEYSKEGYGSESDVFR